MTTNIANMKGFAEPYQNAIAARIARWVYDRRDQKMSLRELSRRAGLNETTAQSVLSQLEEGNGNVGLATMGALANAMGVSLVWLLHGDAPPPKQRLRDLPGWAEAAKGAVGLGADPATVEGMGDWETHEAPAELSGFTIATIARTWKARAK